MKTVMLVDHDSVVGSLRSQGLRPNAVNLATRLRQVARLFDPSATMVAYGNWHMHREEVDTDGTVIPTPRIAFELEGFEARSGATSREEVVDGMTSHILDQADRHGCEQLIVVTDELRLASYIERLRRLRPEVTVRVWGTNTAATELRQSAFNFVNLQEQLDLKIKQGILVVDWENMYLGMQKKSYQLQMNGLIEIINAYADDQGHVVERRAYADFDLLAGSNGQNAGKMQRALEMNGIRTHYVVGTPGKSSADMRIAEDLTILSNQPNPPGFVVLAAGDGDFGPAVSALRRRGIAVVILAFKGATSMALTKMPGVKVDFVDDQLPQGLRMDKPQENTLEPNLLGEVGSSLAAEVRLAAILSEQLRIHAWHWISRENAEKVLVSNGGFNREEARRALEAAEQEGVLTNVRENTSTASLRLNPQHPIVSVAQTILDVIRNRMSHAHTVRGFVKVNEGFLLRGLEMDTVLKQREIELSLPARRAWVNMAIACGLLKAEQIPDEQRPGYMVRALCLTGNTDLTTAGGGDFQGMVKRLVTAYDSFTMVKGTDWAPLKTLDRELSPHGRPAFFKAVQELTNTGAATTQQYANQKDDRPPVTGITLVAGHVAIDETRDERELVVRQLWQLHRKGSAITASVLVGVATPELTEADAQLWLNILNAERALTLRPGPEATYALNVTHQLIKNSGFDQPREEVRYIEMRAYPQTDAA